MSEVLNPITEWATGLSNKEISFCITLLTFPLFIILEWLNPTKRVTTDLRKHSYYINLANLIFNNLILLLLAIEWFYGVAELKSLAFLPWLFSKLPIELYSWLGIGLMILLLDVLIYFWHWLNHRFDFLWNFHRVHHSDSDLNTSTGIRFHLGELLLSLVYKAGIVMIFGIPVEIIVVFEFINVYAASFHHSNIRVPGEKWLRYILVMPSHHATHHSIQRKHHDSNYAVLFSWWDYIFNTFDTYQPQTFGLQRIRILKLNEFIRFGLGAKLPILIVFVVFIGLLLSRFII